MSSNKKTDKKNKSVAEKTREALDLRIKDSSRVTPVFLINAWDLVQGTNYPEEGFAQEKGGV